VLDELMRRFSDGPSGRRRLLEQLLRHDLVSNEPAIAEGLAAAHTLQGYPPGTTLVEQSDADTDVFLILAGEVAIEVHGREVARRSAGEHVGEMALIDPTERRSATARAVTETVVARITEEAFSELAEQHPSMWRRLALQLGNRLRQRAAHVAPRRDRPVVFIGSCSSEAGLSIARAMQTAFAFDPWDTRIWTDGTFAVGKTPIESLMAQLDNVDFALLVVTPDDMVDTGAGGRPSPRDNVIFELGLMMGALGRERAFMVKNRGGPNDLRIPSDLMGVQALEVIPGDPTNLAARVGPAANEFRSAVRHLKGR
jgi:CRP/FNR family cyclic AMP-dependent transcriptional regulator